MGLTTEFLNSLSRYSTAYTNFNKAKTNVEEKTEVVTSEEEDVQNATQAYDESKSKVEGIQNSLTSITNTIQSLNLEISNIMTQITSTTDEKILEGLNNTLESLKAEKARAEEEQRKLEADLEIALAEEETALNTKNTEETELESAKQALTQAQQEYEQALTEYDSAKTALAGFDAQGAEAINIIDNGGSVDDAIAAAEEIAAEEAGETEETEEANLPNGVDRLTEEEALAQGYTIITTPEQLAAIANDLSGKYILMNDIDLAGIDWIPLGQGDPFKGILNGNGYSILNMNVTADEDDTAVGLFAETDGAEILNLILENATVNAGDPSIYNTITAGLLIGIARNTNINNVSVFGDISGYQGIGGVIGTISDYSTGDLTTSTLSNIIANVNIDAAFYAGGIAGKVNSTDLTSLIINNCSTAGSINITDQAAGGIIGQANKTIITVIQCASDMSITQSDESGTGFFPLDGEPRIGDIIGNCNGTYLTIANCDYQNNPYGWYMNDAQISLYDLPTPLPVDDILMIDGVEGIKPVGEVGGVPLYEITVSTLAGMNKIVDMISANPALADQITFNILFDFETIDEEYDNTNYDQYGVVQHLYEDENGNVINFVYIDNEIDIESTFNRSVVNCTVDDIITVNRPQETMVEGLYKANGKYYIFTPGETRGDYENFTEVDLEFFYQNQDTIVQTRLNDEQVNLRELITSLAWDYQAQIQQIIKENFGLSEEDGLPIIEEPEYKYLKQKQLNGETLSNEEMLKIAVFELNYTIGNIVANATNNYGCGMGGDAPFLQSNCYITPDGQYVFANTDEATGETTYSYEDGSLYEGNIEELKPALEEITGQALFEVEASLQQLLNSYQNTTPSDSTETPPDDSSEDPTGGVDGNGNGIPDDEDKEEV